MSDPICIEPECANPAIYTPRIKRCGKCHYQWQKQHGKQYATTCATCGIEYTRHRKPRGVPACSPACRQKRSQPIATAARAEQMRAMPKLPTRPPATQCAWCHALHFDTTKYCGEECRDESARHRAMTGRSRLRAAVEDRDYETVAAELRRQADVTESGCHEWRRKADKHGYPTVKIGKRTTLVHRIALEAKLKSPLGRQTAHHICANRKCINPDHLQQATHRENIGEMAARNDYLARIDELEHALGAISPSHPLLVQAPLGGAARAA